MKEEVDKVLKTGDSLGGVFEVVAHQVPPGLGTYVQWDERLDAMLASAVMSLQAVKAVEIGAGVAAAFAPGSAVHDEIGYTASSGYTAFSRTRNNAGGIEGGISNGQEIRVRGYLKPISTLRRPLQSVDFSTREPVKAAYERSDVCVVPAAGVAAEAMVALTLSRCALEKFGGDSMTETLQKLPRLLPAAEELLMIYPIVKFGNPVLEKPSETVTVFDEELEKLIEDMFESMYAAHGVGLAAPQIGIGRRIAVIDVTFKEDPKAKLVLINPEIIHTEGQATRRVKDASASPTSARTSPAPTKSPSAPRTFNGKVFEKTGRGTAGPRLPPRDRSPERQALHQPHQRPQARPDETQNPQADESRRMVEIGSWEFGNCVI